MPKLKKHRPEKKPRFFKAERPRGRPPVKPYGFQKNRINFSPIEIRV